MPDWFAAFLHQENSNAKGAKIPLAKNLPTPEKTDKTDETYPNESVFQGDNGELPHKSENIDKIDQAQNNELTKLTKPNSDELTKLTKPLREDQVAILEAATAGRPPDVSDPQWRIAMLGLEAFLAAGHGDEAERLGWPPDVLYRVPKLWSQISLTGHALLIRDDEVIEISPTEIRIKTATGATQAFRREPPPNFALMFESLRKQLEGNFARDSTEPRLRSRDATISEYRRFHNVALDDARLAVDSIIAEKGKTP